MHGRRGARAPSRAWVSGCAVVSGTATTPSLCMGDPTALDRLAKLRPATTPSSSAHVSDWPSAIPAATLALLRLTLPPLSRPPSVNPAATVSPSFG